MHVYKDATKDICFFIQKNIYFYERQKINFNESEQTNKPSRFINDTNIYKKV